MDHGAQVTPTPEMLANGQDQNAFYLLHYAVDDGLIEIAKLLIEKGKVPLNTLDKTGWSPLHLASGHNNIDIVTLLLTKGADANIKVRKSLIRKKNF
jgi:ankyrin repeat protein